MIKFEYQEEIEFCISYYELDCFPVCKNLSDQISDNINGCIFLILYNEMCQHLEDLHNAVNQHAPNVIGFCMGKRSIERTR